MLSQQKGKLVKWLKHVKYDLFFQKRHTKRLKMMAAPAQTTVSTAGYRECVNLTIVSACHLFPWTSILYGQRNIVSPSDKCTYCKVLWIKASAKFPTFKNECKCKWCSLGCHLSKELFCSQQKKDLNISHNKICDYN